MVSLSLSRIRELYEKRGSLIGDVLGKIPFVGDTLNPQGQLHPYADAMQEIADDHLRNQAWNDVKNVGLTSLGVGAAGAGLVGLYRHYKKRKDRGSSVLPLPYPVADNETPQALAHRKAAMDAGASRDALVASALGLAGGGVGAGLGALTAPKGHRGEGALRGLAVGAPAGLGAFAYGKGLKGFQEDGGASPKTLAYLAAGSAGALPAALLGKPSWDVDRLNIRDVLKSYVKRDVLKPQPKEEEKTAGITTKSGIPWYIPATILSGMGGLAMGWKGVDSVLKSRAKKEREDELEGARAEFHDALMSQYDKPLNSPKLASDNEIGRELDKLYDQLEKVASTMEKRAWTWSDAGGMAAGGYGAYAGLSGLMTGAIVYNQLKKRSQREVLEKAIKKRDRRRFNLQPNEIYAMPEPFSHVHEPASAMDNKALKIRPEDEALETEHGVA